MARPFTTEKERQFFDNVRQELDNNIIQQQLLYYRIDLDKSTVDEVYGEITKKVYESPVIFYARVLYNEPEVTYIGATMDTIYSMEVYANKKELNARGIIAKAGDYLEYGEDFYEILSAMDTMVEHGEVERKIEIKMLCRSTRKDQFDAPSHERTLSADNYSGSVNPTIPSSDESYVGQGSEIQFPE